METEFSLPHSQVLATYHESDQSNQWSQTISWRTILISSSHLYIGLPSVLFHLGFPTRTPPALLLSPYVLHALPISFFLIWSPNIIDEEYNSLNSSLYSIFLFLVTSSLWPKYFPQHHIREHPKPTFLSQCEWLSFTHIVSISKISPIVPYILIFLFLDSKLEDKTVCTEW